MVDANVLALKDVRGLANVAFTGTKVSDEMALQLKRARPTMRIRDVSGSDVSLHKRCSRPRRDLPPKT